MFEKRLVIAQYAPHILMCLAGHPHVHTSRSQCLPTGPFEWEQERIAPTMPV